MNKLANTTPHFRLAEATEKQIAARQPEARGSHFSRSNVDARSVHHTLETSRQSQNKTTQCWQQQVNDVSIALADFEGVCLPHAGRLKSHRAESLAQKTRVIRTRL